MSKLPPDYDQRVYAGWLGKCTGVRFGAPLENWTYDEIRLNLGEVTDYFPLEPGKIFKPDDDTALPLILIRAIEDFGPEVTAEQFGDTWLNYLGDERGTLWWGGYGVSAEHTAYVNLKNGIPAPQSGSADMNGAVLCQEIGGQIFSDIWGLLVPNNPALAADYAAKAASVSHDLNGIHGARFIAALTSAAFSENKPQQLLEAGLSVIPEACTYAEMVRSVRQYYRLEPHDWRAAYQSINENFGYERFPGFVPIIPNAAVIVLALLYGEGRFSRSIQIANMAGWDTDCNVGNVGAIMGVAVGLAGIADHWRAAHEDQLVAAGIIGTRNLIDLPACAALIAASGRKVAGEESGRPPPRYHISLPGATHGFQKAGKPSQPDQKILHMTQEDLPEGGALKVLLRGFKKKEEVLFFVDTYLRPARLSANYYGATFSPKVYPGQTMRARLHLPPEAAADLHASLFVHDDNQDQRHAGGHTPLVPGQWQDIEYKIPPLDDVCLSQAGVALRNGGQPYTGPLYLDYLDWSGSPHMRFDFTQERNEQGAISQWTFLRGFWRLENGRFHGSGTGINESYTGDIDWQDYQLTVRLTPLLGDFHNILVRVKGSLYAYALGLAAGNRLVLYKNDKGYQTVSEAPFAWDHHNSYELNLKVKGSHLSAWVSGGPGLEWRDDERPHLNGQIGLSNFPGCHTRYEQVSIFPG